MKYAHLIARATGSPWLITEAGLAAVSALIHSRMAAETPTIAPPTPAPDTVPPPEEIPTDDYGGTAVISVHGILGKNLGLMETLCGGCDVGTVLAELTEALASPDVDQVVLDIDSPGGMAAGIPEAHASILRLRAESGKPVYAFTEISCCSAAYYLAAACDAIICTPSATLGSVGTIIQLEFLQGQLAKDGVEVRTYKYGKYKDLGNSARQPTAEEDAMIQSRVDILGKMFEADIRAARPQLAEEVFEARVYYGTEALAVGLADEVVPDLETLLDDLAPEPAATGG